MKGDVTRIGKRTSQGVLADGISSATRYVINNYLDEKRQRGIDLMLGKVTPSAISGRKPAAKDDGEDGDAEFGEP